MAITVRAICSISTVSNLSQIVSSNLSICHQDWKTVKALMVMTGRAICSISTVSNLSQIVSYNLSIYHQDWKTVKALMVRAVRAIYSISTVSNLSQIVSSYLSIYHQDWKTVKALMARTGRQSLKRRINMFDINHCKLDVALGAKYLLGDMNLAEVEEISRGAATFYTWVNNLLFSMEHL